MVSWWMQAWRTWPDVELEALRRDSGQHQRAESGGFDKKFLTPAMVRSCLAQCPSVYRKVELGYQAKLVCV